MSFFSIPKEDCWVLGKKYSINPSSSTPEDDYHQMAIHVESLFRYTYRSHLTNMTPYTANEKEDKKSSHSFFSTPSSMSVPLSHSSSLSSMAEKGEEEKKEELEEKKDEKDQNKENQASPTSSSSSSSFFSFSSSASAPPASTSSNSVFSSISNSIHESVAYNYLTSSILPSTSFSLKHDKEEGEITTSNSHLCGKLKSDAGWGCMLRTAQSLLATTMQRHYLGKDWRLPKTREEELVENKEYCSIIRWFSDYPGIPHYFSLHHLLQAGMKYDKLPGEWFGPSTISYVLRDLTNLHADKYNGSIRILVTTNTIYLNEVEHLCSSIDLDDSLLDLTERLGYKPTYAHKILRKRRNEGDEEDEEDEEEMDSETFRSMSIANLKREANKSRIPAAIPTSLVYDRIMKTIYGKEIASRGGINKVSSLSSFSPFNPSPSNPPSSSSLPPTLSHPLDDPLSSTLSSSSSSSSSPSPISERVNIKDNEAFYDPLYKPPPSQLIPWEKSLLLLIPLRLGMSSVPLEYREEIKWCLRHPNSVGIMGGKPNHAIYFVGYKEKSNCLIGLDPHIVYPSISSNYNIKEVITPTLLHQIHCTSPVSLPFHQLDPSLSIGFYFYNREEFLSFITEYKERLKELKEKNLWPLFHVEQTAPDYSKTFKKYEENDDFEEEDDEDSEKKAHNRKKYNYDEEDDDYVFI